MRKSGKMWAFKDVLNKRTRTYDLLPLVPIYTIARLSWSHYQLCSPR